MRPQGTAVELERRRRRAVQLVEQGESPTVVARILGVTPSSLHRWRRMARRADDLSAKHGSGVKPRLTASQLGELERLLHQGATAHGYSNQLWTAARVARLVRWYFGISYHPEHVR